MAAATTATSAGEEEALGARERTPGRARWRGVLPIAVALAVLLVAEAGVRVARSALPDAELWPTPELQDKFDQINDLAGSRRPDVVLVGDSMLDAGGDPSALAERLPGTTLYNASIAGETLPVISDWTTRIVQPRLRPRVVVIGLSSNELNPRALDDATGAGAYRSSRVVRAADGRGGLVDRADALLLEHSMLYRHRSALRRPFDTEPSNVIPPDLAPDGQNVTYVDRGYLQKGGPAQAQRLTAAVIASLQGYRVGMDNVAMLQEMIRTIRRRGARVLLLAVPASADLVRHHPNGQADHQEAMAAFAGAADRSGARFADAGVWPNALFADPVHVNRAGVARLTAFLAPLIEQEVARARLAEP